jgi:transcription initiation factor IIE alpha subunit
MKTSKEVEENINTNPNAVNRALLTLYEQQTLDEKSSHLTSHTNKMGFNGADAPFGTSLAEQIMKGRTLSDNQLATARRMLKKYVKQITKIYNQ